MSHSIQCLKFRTSKEDKNVLLIGSTEEKVNPSNQAGIIICLDRSGSMKALFYDPEVMIQSVDTNSYDPIQTPNQPFSAFTPMTVSTLDVDDYSSQYSPSPTPQSLFSNTISVSLPGTPMTTYTDYFQKESIDPQTRLGCEESFMGKMLDLFDLIENTQKYKIPLGVIVFGSSVSVITNLDGLNFQAMKAKISRALTLGGGTNYELAIEETLKLKSRFMDGVTTIFLSDGGHCEGKLKKEELIAKYPKVFNYCIGIGEGGSDYDESTLEALGDEFIHGTTPQRIRDFVASISLGIATMRAKNIHIETKVPNTIYIGNMEKKNGIYQQKEMSMLMELYFSVSKDVELTIHYEKNDGSTMSLSITPESEYIDDIEFGDKILHTMETLEKISTFSETTKDMSTKDKIQFLTTFKNITNDHPLSKKCLGTRIHNYYLTVLKSLDKMILTRDEKRLKDLAMNVKSDVYNAVSSAGADSFCTPTPFSSSLTGDMNISNVKCNICCTNDREVVFEPCGHYLCCTSCSLLDTVKTGGCPYCRSRVNGVILVDLVEYQKADDWNMRCLSCNRENVNCISKDCKHIFSCEKCIKRQQREVSKTKVKLIELEKELEVCIQSGSDCRKLQKEVQKIRDHGKKYVACTICDSKCSQYVDVHI